MLRSSQIIFIVMTILVITNSSPIFEKQTKSPFWLHPCGASKQSLSDSQSYEIIDFRDHINRIKIQFLITLTEFNSHKYENLYSEIKFGIDDHQYIPDWVPSVNDFDTICKTIEEFKNNTYSNFLEKVHMDLQKFAVAIEQTLNDTKSNKIHQSIDKTKNYLKIMLCEIETSLVNPLKLSQVDRSIMSELDRSPLDETRRLVRDWGVLLKYQQYLKKWCVVLDQILIDMEGNRTNCTIEDNL